MAVVPEEHFGELYAAAVAIVAAAVCGSTEAVLLLGC